MAVQIKKRLCNNAKPYNYRVFSVEENYNANKLCRLSRYADKEAIVLSHVLDNITNGLVISNVKEITTHVLLAHYVRKLPDIAAYIGIDTTLTTESLALLIAQSVALYQTVYQGIINGKKIADDITQNDLINIAWLCTGIDKGEVKELGREVLKDVIYEKATPKNENTYIDLKIMPEFLSGHNDVELIIAWLRQTSDREIALKILDCYDTPMLSRLTDTANLNMSDKGKLNYKDALLEYVVGTNILEADNNLE